MLSKMLNFAPVTRAVTKMMMKTGLQRYNIQPQKVPVRSSHLVPPNQYDTPIPKCFHVTHASVHNWELLPLFAIIVFDLIYLGSCIVWAIFNKVDVVYKTHSRECISRTMDLRNPTQHKFIHINQRYDPWPEMQDVLDKLKAAERRAMARAETC